MEIKDQFYNAGLVLKKFDKNIFASEYLLGKINFINIAVNQSLQSLHECYGNFIDYLIDNDYEILSQFLFGNPSKEKENEVIAEKYLNGLKWPVTFLKQEGKSWGTLITAIKTSNLKTIFQNEVPIGKYYSDEYSEYCILGGLGPKSEKTSKNVRVSSVFHLIESELNKIKMDFNNVVRTWFYINDILSWYDEFNLLRNDYFNKKNIFNKLIPASTGIGVSNLNSSYLLSAVYAVKPKNMRVKISSVSSPLQCPAVNYKSSFSRAVEFDHPEYKNLIVSGTASINSDGITVNVGNVHQQIDLTMDVVKKILESREMNWENVSKGIIYFKDTNDIEIFNSYCFENNIPDLPLVMVQADICREELLFEIEVDAVKTNRAN